MDSEKTRLIAHILELEQKVFKSLHPFLREEWFHTDLTMPQLRVLFVLFMDGPMRMSVLSSTLGIATATATGIVDRLVERGLITREGDPEDRRAVVCRLSEKGQQLLNRLWESGQARGRSLLETMDPAKLRLIAEAMTAILEAASAVEQQHVRQQQGRDAPRLGGTQ